MKERTYKILLKSIEFRRKQVRFLWGEDRRKEEGRHNIAEEIERKGKDMYEKKKKRYDRKGQMMRKNERRKLRKRR